jgi:ABC-type transport system involved in cytochrome c biogenesis permease subunit
MNTDPQQMHGIIAAVIGVYFVFLVIILAAIIFPFWFILKKAGFSPWLSLVNILPLGTFVLLYILAFAEWKVIPAPLAAWQPPTFPPQPPYPPQA